MTHLTNTERYAINGAAGCGSCSGRADWQTLLPHLNGAQGRMSDAVEAVVVRVLLDAASNLRLLASDRMDEYGPHDARGAAIWDSAAWLTDHAHGENPPDLKAMPEVVVR